MKRIVTIGDCTLVHGDMREVLPGLRQSAALVLTDPPYLLTAGGNTTGEMRGCFAPGVYDNSGALFDIVPWPETAAAIYAAARADADAIVMTNDRNLCEAQLALQGAGWQFHRVLVWDKGTVTPNRWFMQGLEFALYMWRGRARPINDKGAHPLMRCPQVDVTGHPTEKPVALFRRWIDLTTGPGDIVLDPFLGSGTAAIAAMRAGRKFIGVESSERWFEAAVARVEAELAGRQSEFALGGGA